MHELAHIICDHQEPAVQRAIPIPSILRNYDRVAEEEAAYLGGCLHIPREALLHCLKMKMSEAQIAEKYAASLDMVRYRIKVTGVQFQSDRWRY